MNYYKILSKIIAEKCHTFEGNVIPGNIQFHTYNVHCSYDLRVDGEWKKNDFVISTNELLLMILQNQSDGKL